MKSFCVENVWKCCVETPPKKTWCDTLGRHSTHHTEKRYRDIEIGLWKLERGRGKLAVCELSGLVHLQLRSAVEYISRSSVGVRAVGGSRSLWSKIVSHDALGLLAMCPVKTQSTIYSTQYLALNKNTCYAYPRLANQTSKGGWQTTKMGVNRTLSHWGSNLFESIMFWGAGSSGRCVLHGMGLDWKQPDWWNHKPTINVWSTKRLITKR